jgi:hypothetical protein
MKMLREEIRAILAEELAALRAEAGHFRVRAEQVVIRSDADLTRFARDLVARARDASFAADVESGAVRFELAGGGISGPGRPSLTQIVTGPPSSATASAVVLDKKLVTEADVAAHGGHSRVLRVGAHSVVTPLARDEARRLGIRIERAKA